MKIATPLSVICTLICLSWSPRVWAVDEREWEKHHVEAIDNFNRGRYSEAETHVKLAIAVAKKSNNERGLAMSYSLLGSALYFEKKLDEAQEIANRALSIQERLLGKEHEFLAVNLNTLAMIHRDRHEYELAEKFAKRALAIREKKFGPWHIDVAKSLNTLGSIYFGEEKFAKAESIFERCFTIDEKLLAPDDPDLLGDISNLAIVHSLNGKEAKAEPLFKRAIALHEKIYGKDSPFVLNVLSSYAAMLHKLGREADAEALDGRIDRLSKIVLEHQCKTARDSPLER